MKARLKLNDVLAVEAHGLSQYKSAHLLRVSAQRLGKFITKHKIQWRGKKPCYRFCADPESQRQAILKSGLPESTVYMRMTRKHMTIDEAIALGRNSRAKK